MNGQNMPKDCDCRTKKKTTVRWPQPFRFKMGWVMGLEPTTTEATTRRSTNWATPTISWANVLSFAIEKRIKYQTGFSFSSRKSRSPYFAEKKRFMILSGYWPHSGSPIQFMSWIDSTFSSCVPFWRPFLPLSSPVFFTVVWSRSMSPGWQFFWWECLMSRSTTGVRNESIRKKENVLGVKF